MIFLSIVLHLTNAFSDNLKNLGFTNWVGDAVSHFLTLHLGGASAIVFLIAMMTFYLFTAYFFASATAKVVALGPVILGALMTLLLLFSNFLYNSCPTKHPTFLIRD